jgi:hypothetical protein
MKIVILILLLFTGGSVIKAQRHYKRISALEGSYGTNIFGKADNMANISFSKYIDRTSYWGITNILYKSNSKVIFSQKYT